MAHCDLAGDRGGSRGERPTIVSDPPAAASVSPAPATICQTPSLRALSRGIARQGTSTRATTSRTAGRFATQARSTYCDLFGRKSPFHPKRRDDSGHQVGASSLTRMAIEGDVRVAEGNPVAAVVNAAEELPAELVVVATRGRTGLRRLALGSVADGIVRAAPCSVLVVRLGADAG